ncbi:5-methylcytosine-specific restriction enzyme A (EcoKMcrA) [Clostridium sp. D5]|nr:5-methylcytosine-specific restriction enzyme A (EcoKMcrA) [Clostridium sp. D5]
MAISIAKRDVYEAKRPSDIFNEWEQEGWRVDATYIPFNKQIITSDFIEELLKSQPQKYAPFNKSGGGNTGYLFKANKSMYELIIKQTAAIQMTEQERQSVIALLDPKDEAQEAMTELEIVMDLEEAKARQLSPEGLAAQVKNGKAKKAQKSETTVYYRNPYVKEMVKHIAEGKCQMCSKEAPFYDKDSKPYLEEHHVNRLADGGSDTMDNVVALCPNCHRKIHVLNDEQDTILLEKIAEKNDKYYQRLLAYEEKMESKNSSNSSEAVK